jgi:hypothetical protein
VNEDPALLYCQVLPVTGYRLLIPNGAVVEVIPLSMASRRPTDGTPISVPWREETLRLVCFESLSDTAAPEFTPRTRVAVLRVPGTEGTIHIGLLIQGYPQMVPVLAEQLKALPLTEQDQALPVLCRVHFARGEMHIPDLVQMGQWAQGMSRAPAGSAQISPVGLQDGKGSEGSGLGAQNAGAEPESMEIVPAGDELLLVVEPPFGADEECH